MKDMINKEAHLRALKVVAEAYQTVHFGGIFPLLAEDCVWESQWRIAPECGRDQVIRYYTQKITSNSPSKPASQHFIPLASFVTGICPRWSLPRSPSYTAAMAAENPPLLNSMVKQCTWISIQSRK